MMLSAIVLAAGLTSTGVMSAAPDPICSVVVLGKHAGDAPNHFVGGADGAGIWIGRVGSSVIAGMPGRTDISELWVYRKSLVVSFGSGFTNSPDLILPVTPGERITIPPVTDEQRRECGGAVS